MDLGGGMLRGELSSDTGGGALQVLTLQMRLLPHSASILPLSNA